MTGADLYGRGTLKAAGSFQAGELLLYARVGDVAVDIWLQEQDVRHLVEHLRHVLYDLEHGPAGGLPGG